MFGYKQPVEANQRQNAQEPEDEEAGADGPEFVHSALPDGSGRNSRLHAAHAFCFATLAV